jgi:hypothetical protein
MKTREELLNQLGQLEGYFDELKIFQVLAKDYSADAVDRILDAPTQAQLDCPYCHGTDNLNDTTNRNNDFQIKIDLYGPDDARLNVEYRGGADREIAHINYCPVCGYRLKGRANDD